MEWIHLLGHVMAIVALVVCTIFYLRARLGLNDTLGALTEIRGLVLYATKAMADGRLTEGERDEIIDRVAAVAKRFV